MLKTLLFIGAGVVVFFILVGANLSRRTDGGGPGIILMLLFACTVSMSIYGAYKLVTSPDDAVLARAKDLEERAMYVEQGCALVDVTSDSVSLSMNVGNRDDFERLESALGVEAKEEVGFRNAAGTTNTDVVSEARE